MNARFAPPTPRTSTRSRSILIALLALTAVILPTAPAAAADAGDVTWTVRTASNDLGADRTNFTYTLDPGGSVTDAVVVANHGSEPVELKIYGTDGFTSDDGQLALRLAGEESTAVGAWLAPASGTVTVAAGATTTVPFTVGIPANATPGDYAGGLVTSLTVPDAASGVNVDRRLAIRVNLRVGGALTPSLAVENMSVSWNGGLNPFSGGDTTVSYTLHNTGNAALSATSSLRVAGAFGILGMDAPVASAVPELLPGENWVVTTTLPAVPPLFALFATAAVSPIVVDASGSTTPMDDVSATGVGAAIPWTLLAVIVLVAVGIFLLVRSRGKRRIAAKQREDARIDEAIAQALEQERTKASTPVQ